MNQNNIQTGFNELGLLAQQLDATGNYNIDMLLSSLRHMLIENNFFYGTLAKNHREKNPSKVFYNLPFNPQAHQLVYVQLGCGYAKEMRDPHWCYILTSHGQKLTVVPLTSIKNDSSPAKEPFEFDIVEGDGVKGRMHFDDMRSIDKMRVIAKKGYRSVQTPRADIEAALKKYIGL